MMVHSIWVGKPRTTATLSPKLDTMREPWHIKFKLKNTQEKMAHLQREFVTKVSRLDVDAIFLMSEI